MTSSLQLVTGEGTINKDETDQFFQDKGLTTAGVDYQVVAIMGPQSSGKSTLLNNLFGTEFAEMDAMSGRGQTTKGIWLSPSPKIDEPVTFVMDLEGTDGRERGEDDTSFERQSALFALSVSDILLINIWCHDIGREQGSGKPLMKTVLQVNLKLFTPAPGAKKTVLLFVIRDRSKTPLPMLKAVLREDLNKMWHSITKPAEYENSELDDFFEVAYTSLPNFEEKEEEFKAESVVLRKRFTPGEEDTLCHSGEDGKLPGNAVSFNMCSIWELIKDHKDLNLPAHKVMVANIRCTDLQNEQYQAFVDDQIWQDLRQEAEQQLVEDFGTKVSSLMDSVITGYDVEARYFDAKISSDKRADLLDKLHGTVRVTYDAQCGHMKDVILGEFKSTLDRQMESGDKFVDASQKAKVQALTSFDKKQHWMAVSTTDWTTEQLSQDLQQSIDEEIQNRRVKRVTELLESGNKQLDNTLCVPAHELAENMPADLWTQLDRLMKDTTTSAFKTIKYSLQGYEMTEEELTDAETKLDDIATEKLERLTREASHTVLSRMQYKFSCLFSQDEQGLPRTWGVRDDIPKAARQARLAAGHVLVQLCIFRVSNGTVVQFGKIDETIKNFIERDMEETSGRLSQSSTMKQSDLLTMTDWPDSIVDSSLVLLPPAKVRQVWKQFFNDSRTTIQQAVVTQQANRMASNRMPPVWALLLLVFLGFDEVMAVVYSPLYLIFTLVIGAFLYTVWRELDVENEMQKGFLPGAITVGRRFYPTMRKVSYSTFQSTLGSIHHFLNEESGSSSNSSNTNNNTNINGQYQSNMSSTTPVSQREASVNVQNGIKLDSLPEESVASNDQQEKKDL